MTVFIETTCVITMIIGIMILIFLLVDRVVGLIRLSNIIKELFSKVIVGISSALLLAVILFAIATTASLFISLVGLLVGVIS